MTNKTILSLIGKAIREARYLSISYLNSSGEVTPFWIAILDINAQDEMWVNMFNVTKDEPLLNKKIFISKIQSAEILKFSQYDVPEKLIEKINTDESLAHYEFDNFDSRRLNYYLECYSANKDHFLYKQHLIPGLDVTQLLENNPFTLDEEQQKRIIKELYHSDYDKHHYYELAINEFSIELNSRGKFVVAYRKLSFDPVTKTLHIAEKVSFNTHFFIENIKHSLSYYTDMSPTDFQDAYNANSKETIHQLEEAFHLSELINTNPEIIVMGYAQLDISATYVVINSDHKNNNLEVPLKAFFQNMSSLDTKNRKRPNIVLYDNKVNTDQLRSIYNALKYPITYVQGPPGTGKTQTILNIAINCFTSDKTALITSNNNVPIDGIYDKLVLGNYKKKEILFPVLRIGNKHYISEALKKIEQLYTFETNDIPKEELLNRIKERSKENNRLLDEKLENFEQKLELEQNLMFIDGLIAKGSYGLLEQEKVKIENRLKELTVTDEDDFKGIFEVIENNHQLLQFFYYESLKYVKRLKTKDFSELHAILDLAKEEDQAKEFNQWLREDNNLEKLTKVFPIILTTNLSCRNLGKKFKFDILVMDEAGQCDIATSLVPISKCRNMVLIGDTNQLKPIMVFDKTRNKRLMETYSIPEPYNYYDNSILSVYKSIDNISRDILLRNHYRCGKTIIHFSNMRFYENQLNLDNLKNTGTVQLLPVTNARIHLKNSQVDEAESIITYIRDNKLKDVFILTPFRNQEATLNKRIKMEKENGNIDQSVQCGTIHKVQGRENKTVIISTAISKKTSPQTYDWIKNNSQLINVGVTRAKENLIVVTDKEAIDRLSRKDDDLYALIDYADKKGRIDIGQSNANKFTIGFSNDSVFEDEFYKTMQHYCTIKHGRFERNVKVIHLFPEELNNHLVNKKEFDGVLYEGNVPKIVFEINGTEHVTNSKRVKSDRIKMELLKRKNIDMISIPNHFVKHYEFIRELIGKFNGQVYQKTLFDYESESPND